MKSRLSAVSQLFTHGEYTYYRSGSMGTLNHGEIMKSHHLIREDLQRSAYASYLAELADRLLTDDEASAYLFEQLDAALDGMEENKDPQIITHIMELKILHVSGFSPRLDQCVACGASGPFPHFSVSLGGVLCARCADGDPARLAVTPQVSKLLEILQKADLRRLGKVQVSPRNKLLLRQCMRQFIQTHVPSQLKTLRFLEQMEKYGLSSL